MTDVDEYVLTADELRRVILSYCEQASKLAGDSKDMDRILSRIHELHQEYRARLRQ